MTTIPDPLKLARDALQSPTSRGPTWALIENYADAVCEYNAAVRIDVGIDKAGAECLRIEKELRAHLAALAAIDALPASVPSGEPAEFDGRVIVGHAGHRGGWCVFEETAPDEFVPIKGPFATRPEADAAMRDGAAPAAPAPAAVPASEPNESLVIGQAQQLIGALIAHRLLHKSMPEPDYINLWDVVKRHLRLVNKEGARTMSAAPAVAAPEPLRAAAQAVLDRWNSPRWEWSKQGPTADLMHALADALTSPAQREPLSEARVNALIEDAQGAFYPADMQPHLERAIARAAEAACAAAWGVKLADNGTKGAARREPWTALEKGLIAGDCRPCPNDHDPDCRWPQCVCREREAAQGGTKGAASPESHNTESEHHAQR